jgi:predicted transcriptional regulator
MKTLRIGIASYEDMKRRTIDIAAGQTRPRRDEPTVWFTSLESVAKVLSDRNKALLELIAQRRPASLTELETLSGRAKSNLSRTLRTLERYGLVTLDKTPDGRLVPSVPFDRVAFEVPLLSTAA